MTQHLRLAVTGMAICNSLGDSLEEVWANTLAMRSGVRTLERKADDPPDFFDSVSYQPGLKSYCDVLAPISINISREDVGLPPQDFRVMPTSARLTMLLANKAIADAGLAEAGYAPERVAVIVSQNAGESAGTLRDLHLSISAGWIADLAEKTLNLSEAQKNSLASAILQSRILPDESTMLCRLNCTAAGMLCNKHNFAGPSFSVGAACSSSMAALHAAFMLMRAGLIDAAVVGGGEEVYSPLWLAEFSAIGALARRNADYSAPESLSRPFDLKRNGFVLGEGGAVIVVEREDTARRRGTPIHGFISGAGSSTNSKGIIEPSAGAQLIAARQSFAGLPYGPDQVDLIECHATATVQGDLEEARAVAEIYAGSGETVISAYKGQIGHSIGSSGLMAVIHGFMSMRDKIYPGTLNHNHPDPQIALESYGLRVLPEPAPWPEPASGIRRMQINSFGFGGSNFIFQAEEYSEKIPGKPLIKVPEGLPGPQTVEYETKNGNYSFAGREAIVDGVRLVITPHQGADWRLGSLNANWRMDLAGLSPSPSEAELESLGRQGLWLRKEAKAPPLALMCCGQGAIWPGVGRALYDSLPAAREAMDRIAKVADWDILGLMDETDPEKIALTRWQQPYLFLLEYAQFYYLRSLGLKPSAIAGHSLGELIALCLCGVYTPEEAWYIVDTRACLMEHMEKQSDRGTGMMAVHAPAEQVHKVLEEHKDLTVSNYNSPSQVILGGPRDTLQEVRKKLRHRKIPAVMLPMSLAFHHPGMRVLREKSMESLRCVDMRPARLPMMSNVTAGLYPEDHEGIVSYIADLDENPVRWPECVEALWHKFGVRHFLEFGPSDVLCGLVDDIIPESVCVAAGKKNKEIEGMRTAVARLFALGHLPFKPEAKKPAPSATEENTLPRKPSAVKTVTKSDQLIEQVMPVIMQATGYERRELEPDMDLRHDLAIRSSRFPLIMHEAEKEFGIAMHFEDLLGVATIRDLALKINELRKNEPNETAEKTVADNKEQNKSQNGKPEAARQPPIYRYVPETFPLGPPSSLEDAALRLPLKHIFIFGNAPEAALVLAEIYGRDCRITINPAAESAPRLFSGQAERGLFIFTDDEDSLHTEPSRALTRWFKVIKSFLGSKGAALCCVAGKSSEPVMAGLTGLALSAALENPQTIFRCVETGANQPKDWLAPVLRRPGKEPGNPGHNVRLIFKDGRLFSVKLRPVPLDPANPGLPLREGDVIVISGGAGGIMPEALRALAGENRKLIIMGRSARPGSNSPIWRLAGSGTEVDYLSCDITDSKAVQKALAELKEKYGRLDGILHAAGITVDATLEGMEPESFEAVVAVKCRGLHALLKAGKALGLRYAMAFSSMAAWLGNYGQANYCAANAAMGAILRQSEKSVPCICFMLPPIAGQGMAGNLAEEMRARGLGDSFINTGELSELLRREISHGTPGDILWARSMPATPGTAVPYEPDKKAVAGIVERPGLYPLVFPLNMNGVAEFTGGVHFSAFKFPCLESSGENSGRGEAPAWMTLECLFEGAAQFFPGVRPSGARKVLWSTQVAVPHGLTREGKVICRPEKNEGEGRAVICRASLEVTDVADNGRKKNSASPACSGLVVMRGEAAPELSGRSADAFTLEAGIELGDIAATQASYIFPAILFNSALNSAVKVLPASSENIKKRAVRLLSLDSLKFLPDYMLGNLKRISIRLTTAEPLDNGRYCLDAMVIAPDGKILLLAENLVLTLE